MSRTRRGGQGSRRVLHEKRAEFSRKVAQGGGEEWLTAHGVKELRAFSEELVLPPMDEAGERVRLTKARKDELVRGLMRLVG